MYQEQSLNMSLSQHLAMTMKLQQAIQILQLSAQDLRAEIEKEYLENPALDMEYDDGTEELPDGNFRDEDIAALAEYLGSDTNDNRYAMEDAPKSFEAAAPISITLEEELLEQVNFTFTNEKERAVATFLVGSINDSGYLAVSETAVAAIMEVTVEFVEEILTKIQQFEPVGVGAHDLAECLRLQAKSRGIYDGLVAAVIDKHLDAVAANQIKEIAVAEKVKATDVQLAVDIVRQLDPKPGSAYGTNSTVYITPDVLVEKVDGTYRVSLNDNYIPKLRLAAAYKHPENFDGKTKKYITKRLSAAAWLINSIEQRRSTIRKVVEEIVRVQQDFLEKGKAYLHPLTMKDVAEAIGVHESTVSRAVANKYAEMPNGIMPLRKFFTANLAKNGNGEDFIASQAKAVLQDLIKGENPQKPLSDQKLCTLLKERNMDISRRTVMKYREQLGYPSSVKRKRY